MHLAKTFEVLAKHIIKIEEENQLKDWEISNLRKELEQLRTGLEEKIKKYDKEN